MGIDDAKMMDPNAVARVSPVAPGSVPAPGKETPEVQGADFSRILEELLASAGHLDARAAAPASDPKELREAVEEAKQSLDAAVALGESLLDAYRRTLIAPPVEPGRPGAPEVKP